MLLFLAKAAAAWFGVALLLGLAISLIRREQRLQANRDELAQGPPQFPWNR